MKQIENDVEEEEEEEEDEKDNDDEADGLMAAAEAEKAKAEAERKRKEEEEEKEKKRKVSCWPRNKGRTLRSHKFESHFCALVLSWKTCPLIPLIEEGEEGSEEEGPS